MRLTAQEVVENVAFAVSAIRAHKFRSSLTVLSMAVGTMTVMAVSSVFTGLEVRTHELAEKLGPNVLYITKYDWTGHRGSSMSQEERMRKPIKYEDAVAIAQLSAVKAASPFLIFRGSGPDGVDIRIRYRGIEVSRPDICGVWPNYLAVRNLVLKEGRAFTQTEHDRRLLVSVIGSSVADTLFGPIDPLGKNLVIENTVFRVIGVLERSPGGLFGGDNMEDWRILVPYATLKRLDPTVENRGLRVMAHSQDDQFDMMVDQITALMRRRRGVHADQPNNFGLNKPMGAFERVRDIGATIALIVIPISAASLLVGGVGVMNIMLVSVTERTREIGVRRAIGARRRDIVQQFLMEAATLSLMGGVFGILLGGLVSKVLNHLVPQVPSQVPLWSVMAGLGVSISVGIIFGLWPAIKAARLAPSQAISYE